MNLAHFQDRLSQLLLNQESPTSVAPLPGIPQTSGVRKIFELYRSQALDNLHHHMQTIFPICQRLLTPPGFRQACDSYFNAHIPKAINPLTFAEEFPSFIEGFQTDQAIPYLPDVATLDYGCFQSSQAIDVEAMNTKAFSNLSPEQLATRRIQLHPACFWMTSPYAIYDIWQRYRSGHTARIDPNLTAQEVVIIRPADTVEVHKVDAGFIKAMDTLDSGETLNQALLQGSLEDEGFNPVAAIQFLIQNRLIAGLY